MRGIVVVSGYSDGSRVALPAGKVFETRILTAAILGATSLRDALQWLDGESWRPKRGTHYNVVVSEHMLGSIRFQWNGTSLADVGPLLAELFGRRRPRGLGMASAAPS